MEYHWYKKENKLLEEIKNTNPHSGMLAVWYVGQMGIVVKGNGVTVCIDPVFNDLCYPDGSSRRNYEPPFEASAFTGIDYIICSHNHADHMNMETLLPLHRANPNAKFIVPSPEIGVLAKDGIAAMSVIGTREKEVMMLKQNLQICPIAAAHEKYVTDSYGQQKNLGYILKFDNIQLYHAGDTMVTEKLIADVQERGKIHIACIPVNGVDAERHRRGILGNMDCRDGAFFAEQIKADLVFPMHCDMVKRNEENPLVFAYYMQSLYAGRKYHIMQLGERFLYMP